MAGWLMVILLVNQLAYTQKHPTNYTATSWHPPTTTPNGSGDQGCNHLTPFKSQKLCYIKKKKFTSLNITFGYSTFLSWNGLQFTFSFCEQWSPATLIWLAKSLGGGSWGGPIKYCSLAILIFNVYASYFCVIMQHSHCLQKMSKSSSIIVAMTSCMM